VLPGGEPGWRATTMTITDITHGVSVPGPFVADNALHCVPGVNIPSAPVTFLLDAEKGCIGSNATVTIMIESCTKPAPTLHQFYASLILFISVRHKRWTSAIRWRTRGWEYRYHDDGYYSGRTGAWTIGSDNALHCVPCNIPTGRNDSLTAKHGCQISNPPELDEKVLYSGPEGKVPGLTGVGAIILTLILAVFAVSRLRKKRSSG